jgi:FkbM family methyltransferase
VRITAFEPDPGNADVLKRCIRANQREDAWRVVEACAADKAGSIPFATGRFIESHAAASGDVATTVPAVDVFPYLEDADVVKMNIEGGEWAILGDPRFRAVPAKAIALQYHPHLCPQDDPRELATAILRDAGYKISPIFHVPGDTGKLWAWKDR